jgi:hypothetical protein
LASHGVVVFENSVRYQLLNHSGTKTKVEDDLLSAEELEWCRRMSEVCEEKKTEMQRARGIFDRSCQLIRRLFLGLPQMQKTISL